MKQIENFSYCLERNGWTFRPNATFTKWDVYNGENLVIEVEWDCSLKIEKYNVKVYDKDNLFLSALVVLSIILLNSYHSLD